MSFRHSEHPYAEWLADLSCPLLAIACEAVSHAPGFAHVSHSNRWNVDAVVEEALTLHRSHSFDRVIGLGEVDILPAGRIRESLNLPGQWEASARAYRDKLAMRQHAVAGGVSVPPFAAADSADDVIRFMCRHGAPVMVKPRLGVGAVGIRRVDNLQMAAALTSLGESDCHLVERFVEGPTFHVDAIRVDGAMVLAVPCAYTGHGCISHWDDSGIGSYTLALDNPLFHRLVEATGDVAEALPGPPDLAIHAEFFLAGDEIVLCEAASRGGGGGIPSMLTRRLGVDMRHLWVRIQCGLQVDWDSIERRLNCTQLVANFGLPPRDGRIRELPRTTPIGVEDLEIRVSPGEDFAGPRYASRHSGDLIATWVVTAADEAELVRAINNTAAAMERLILWDAASLT